MLSLLQTAEYTYIARKENSLTIDGKSQSSDKFSKFV